MLIYREVQHLVLCNLCLYFLLIYPFKCLKLHIWIHLVSQISFQWFPSILVLLILKYILYILFDWRSPMSHHKILPKPWFYSLYISLTKLIPSNNSKKISRDRNLVYYFFYNVQNNEINIFTWISPLIIVIYVSGGDLIFKAFYLVLLI